MPFSPEVKSRIFTRSNRLCCLCLKQCGTNIEAAHIIAECNGGSNDEENGIPLCLDCHQEAGAYNDQHPKGNKIREDELRGRRNRVYSWVESGQIFGARPPIIRLQEVEVQAGNGSAGPGGNAIIVAPPGHGLEMIGGSVRGGDGGVLGGKGGDVCIEGGPGVLPISEIEMRLLSEIGRKKEITVRQAALALGINEEKVKFFFDELAHKRQLLNWYGNMDRRNPVRYTLTHEGRRQLIQRGEFD
jgi:hypothetical protein